MSWRGLSVVGGRLRYRPKSLWWRRSTLRFEPEAVAVVPRSGPTTLLPWETSGTGWQLVGVYASRANRAGIEIRLAPARLVDVWHPVYGSHSVWLPSTWSTPPIEELPALTDFLTATPAARPSLADGARLDALLAALATRSWQKPAPPGEPLAGDGLDLHVAIGRALDGMEWRRYRGRPVRGEGRPDQALVAERARARLTRAVSGRTSDEELAAAVRRHVGIGEWPFDVLLPAPPVPST
ncbi:MAG TPA: hypothetical protein VFJ85_01605 [Acidimicrobiales bacterium]|nr:hypothetical protein [Acidimicrobiales bacterium]